MANIFNTIQAKKPNSNVFDLSYDMKLSLKMGQLIPIHCQEVVPGDKFTQNVESMLRMAPMLSPVMHKVNVTTHFFFVPNRLLWDGWEDFITGNLPEAETPAFPYVNYVTIGEGSIPDYLGLPTGVEIDKVSPFPMAAYQFIYNEFYRDQNLIDPIDYKLVDGNNTTNWSVLAAMRRRAWQHDYFTAALPWAQKGDAVTLPLAGFNDVPVVRNTSDPESATIWTSTTPAGRSVRTPNENLSPEHTVDSSLYAKTSEMEGSSTTINTLRIAFRLQEWLEKNARAGTRYIESILSHFGVRSSDARLQRPEFLGGSRSPMVISEVLQTAPATEVEPSPQGNMAGHGISVGNGRNFSRFFEEHGYIIGIMNVQPITAYQQGIPRHFSKFDRLAYYFPSFAHLGEQEVLNRELYYANDGQNDNTFGYVPRYSEYRYNASRVAGEFRSTLDFWHMGRKFSNRPQLNKTFIEADPTTRIFAVEADEEDTLYAHVFHNIKAVRRMPKYGTPMM